MRNDDGNTVPILFSPVLGDQYTAANRQTGYDRIVNKEDLIGLSNCRHLQLINASQKDRIDGINRDAKQLLQNKRQHQPEDLIVKTAVLNHPNFLSQFSILRTSQCRNISTLTDSAACTLGCFPLLPRKSA